MWVNEKRKKRKQAVDYLLQGGNEYIKRYPRRDLKNILSNNAYHSEEWEETDDAATNVTSATSATNVTNATNIPDISDATDNGDNNNQEASSSASVPRGTSIYVYEKWWRSASVS